MLVLVIETKEIIIVLVCSEMKRAQKWRENLFPRTLQKEVKLNFKILQWCLFEFSFSINYFEHKKN